MMMRRKRTPSNTNGENDTQGTCCYRITENAPQEVSVVKHLKIAHTCRNGDRWAHVVLFQILLVANNTTERNNSFKST